MVRRSLPITRRSSLKCVRDELCLHVDRIRSGPVNAAASVEFALENEIDARVGLRLLEGFGVLPSGRNVVVVEEAKPEDNRTPEEKHDDLVEDYLKRALKMACVRNKVFGTPLPEVAGYIHRSGQLT